jgi:hypothetical protein
MEAALLHNCGDRFLIAKRLTYQPKTNIGADKLCAWGRWRANESASQGTDIWFFDIFHPILILLQSYKSRLGRSPHSH